MNLGPEVLLLGCLYSLAAEVSGRRSQTNLVLWEYRAEQEGSLFLYCIQYVGASNQILHMNENITVCNAVACDNEPNTSPDRVRRNIFKLLTDKNTVTPFLKRQVHYGS